MSSNGVFFGKERDEESLAKFLVALEKEGAAYHIDDRGHGWLVFVTGF